MLKKQILIILFIVVACKSKFEKTERKTFLPANKTESIVNDYSNLFTTEGEQLFSKRLYDYHLRPQRK